MYLTSVFFHIIAACLWLGGMLFLMFAFIPGIRQHPDKVNLILRVSQKFRVAGMVALVVLLITGVIQLEYRGVQWTLKYFTGSSFGRIAGMKILVFIAILFISLLHDHYLGSRTIDAWKNNPDHYSTIRLRNLSRLMGRVSFLLALVAVFLGILLVRGW